MKKLLMTAAFALAGLLAASAETITVKTFRYAGPYPVKTPFMTDSVDVNSKPFDITYALETPVSAGDLKNAGEVQASALPTYGGGPALNIAGFSLQNTGYTEAVLKVEGPDSYKVYVDGKAAGKELKLSPATHTVEIRYISTPDKNPGLTVTVETDKDGSLSVSTSGKHLYGMKDVLLGTRYSGVSVSPDGKYMIVSYNTTFEGGNSARSSKLMETATGKVIKDNAGNISWMPVSNKYYYTERTASGLRLTAVDPATGKSETLAEDIPEGWFTIAPSEDYLLYTLQQKGPEEREEIYQIIVPDDRQPGWRNRSYPAKYSLKDGVLQRLVYGYNNAYISDISPDGKHALLQVSKARLTKRPTTLSYLYLLDMETLQAETLVDGDGFMGSAQFSPDGKEILLGGSPEAFGGIGKNVAPGQTPNMTDQQLYIMNLATKKIRPMTKDFDPNVKSSDWCRYDGKIYFTAENKDLYSLFRMDPRSGKTEQIPTSEDLVNGLSAASAAPVIAYYGQGAMNSDRLYTLDTRNGKSSLKEDLSAGILKDVELGECHEWNFKNSKGETVYGRYYLPPHFDASKKYPMIVNYYGGCSPTSRNFESRYPHHAYAALGYVVYIVAVPSGATGNGQKWSARHVNTAGDGPAQDIIEGAKKVCEEHPFVNEKKVGCIGASYGGFMSQYMPTLTDFFACSVSHAGISDHTSYWGFGYWGYTYSETSMANSYPWSDKELYVDHSPLYRADKVNTPILFVHGDSDTNVPFNESVQMFTALKLLGKETAFVAVTGENHHILQYKKRLEWQDTIWAWFAKWLQDDPSWWDSIYSPKSL